MQITSRFTIAVHILTAVEYFQDDHTVTSSFLAGSIGANPVIVRTLMSSLKEAGFISISQGKSGITLAKDLKDITFFDVYEAINCQNEKGLFHFHDNPNPECPVGRNIQSAMEDKLEKIQESMEAEMRKVTVADVTRDIRKELRKEKRSMQNAV